MLKRVGVTLAGLYVVFLIWEQLVEDRLIPKRWGVVEEGSIYRSGQLDAALVKSTLVEHEIDVIVNLNRWRLDRRDQAAEEAAVDELGIEKARYPMLGDGTGDPENYVLAVARVHEAVQDGERVLVHCTAGSQRTGAVIALYRLLVQGFSRQDVLDEMERYRFDREDDVALLQFVDNNMAFISRRLNELGVLDEVPAPLPKLLDQPPYSDHHPGV